MKNLDNKKSNKEIQNALSQALRSEDENAIAEAFSNFASSVQENILNEATQITNEMLNDNSVLASRGLRILTKAENSYYNEVIAGEGFGGVEQLVPPTIFERVFENLVQEHPLLSFVDGVNTTGITKWIAKKGNVKSAWWGKLTDEVKKGLDEGFETYNTELYKLSAYLPVAKTMLALGPVWIDKYVRTILVESSALGLEEGIICGTGKDEPIGMMKDLDGAVTAGKYKDKTKKILTALNPVTFGAEIVAPLTNSGKKKVDKVLMVVNPVDYWEKIYPVTTILNQNGSYVFGVLPFPVDVVQSSSIAKGTMIVGIGKDYFMGLGSNQQISVSEEHRFIQDERTYLTTILANGRPKDNSSFLVFDISGLVPNNVTPVVTP